MASLFGMTVLSPRMDINTSRGIKLSPARTEGLNGRRLTSTVEMRAVYVQPKSGAKQQKGISPTLAPGQSPQDLSTPSSQQSSIVVEDVYDVGQEFTRLDLDSPEDIFTAMKALINAIASANIEEVKALDDVKKLESLVNNFVKNKKNLLAEQRTELLRLFDVHPVIRELESECSFLWAAVEYALSTKKSKSKYNNYLEIIKILARVTSDKSEQHALRPQVVPSWWSWFCLPCCGPFLSASSDVKGGLLHRAAMGGNTDILDILLKNGSELEMEDENEWTAWTYACIFKHKTAAQFLATRGATLHAPSCLCCYE